MRGLTELLAIKDATGFFRFNGEKSEHCEMAKASVYPISQAAHVEKLFHHLESGGYPEIRIVKLTIKEEPYIST